MPNHEHQSFAFFCSGTLCAAILLTGCQTIQPQQYSAWRLSDPAASSPYKQPLSAAPQGNSQSGTNGLGTNGTDRNGAADPAGSKTSPLTDAQTFTREKLDAPVPSNANRGSITDNPVKLVISDPANAKIDETVSFRLTLTNAGKTDLKNLELVCDFDRELVFPGLTERRLQQPIATLDAGETRIITLALKVQEFGRPCLAFTLRVPSRDDVVVKRCVAVDPPDLELTWDGPEERPVNTRAEFLLTLQNRSGQVVPQAELVVSYDPSLSVRAGSAGVLRRPQELVWNLGTLKVDERVKVEMEFECLQVVDPSMLRVVLRSAGATVASSERRLNITRSTDVVGQLSEH